MKYYKIVKDGYILAVGTNTTGVEITKSEYENILQIASECPAADNGFGHRLTENLQWEEFKMMPTGDELTDSEALAIIMGGAV